MFHAEQSLDGARRPVRQYSDQPTYKRPVDAQERSRKLTALAWSPAGLIMGFALGMSGTNKYGWPGWTILVTAILGWMLVYFGPLFITHLGAKIGGTLYAPSGSTTPHDKEYSYQESLVARGMYEEAVNAFELAVQESPEDPTPYLRVARILRDHLERHDDAARWFRRVQRDTEISGGHALLARKELIELYWHKMGEPTKAAPDLARMAEELEGTPEGERAANDLKQVKELIAQQQDFD